MENILERSQPFLVFQLNRKIYESSYYYSLYCSFFVKIFSQKNIVCRRRKEIALFKHNYKVLAKIRHAI